MKKQNSTLKTQAMNANVAPVTEQVCVYVQVCVCMCVCGGVALPAREV